MKFIFRLTLLGSLSVFLISCDVYRRINTAFFPHQAEAALSGEDLEVLTQNLITSVNWDTGYISDENLPYGSFETKTDSKAKDIDGNGRSEKTAYVFKKDSEGQVHINKDFTGEVTHTLGTYEINSNADYIYTPDREAMTPFTGHVDLESHVHYRKDRGGFQEFKVAAKGLHRSSCGVDEGTIHFSNSSHSYVIEYNGCGFSHVTKVAVQ